MKKRLSPHESRAAALEAARLLLIEQGPHAVTLKAVAARIGRTHANLLHHFGSVSDLWRALAQHMAGALCETIGQAVLASRLGALTPRELVDIIFDSFEHQGAASLAVWLRLTGDAHALEPIIEAIETMLEELHDLGSEAMRHVSHSLVLLAVGDGLLGAPMTRALHLPRDCGRDVAERLLVAERARAGVIMTPVLG
ncbi:TetR/AcrR family transcriptional regulator [Novosphingobium terrae]|uniref:TetR/AcrR family transcriptional regulator n=1 Tax=Novosphingobium terrae TaxID=2726189 RepID=UPI002AC365A5|nr:TetR/AcrR family transcriptional regulator [Novosphingobium terrae]